MEEGDLEVTVTIIIILITTTNYGTAVIFSIDNKLPLVFTMTIRKTVVEKAATKAYSDNRYVEVEVHYYIVADDGRHKDYLFLRKKRKKL